MFFKKFFINYLVRRNKIVSSKKFQFLASKFFFSRIFVKSDGKKIYDLVAGFVYSQTLLSFVELGLLDKLLNKEHSIQEISKYLDLNYDKARLLCQSGAAIGILEIVKKDTYVLSRIGSAIVGVPGLQEMICHHKIFYDDLKDPVELLKGKIDTKMSKFWPYIVNKNYSDFKKIPTFPISKKYSDLMASSQILVSEETLGIVSLKRTKHILDIGGGTGTFLSEVKKSYPNIVTSLFDLKNVVRQINEKEKKHKAINNIFPGNFLEDNLPKVADTISLVRVLYDHDDLIAQKILRKVYNALPIDGTIIISEPMSGGDKPARAGDSYFGFYTLAMTTGKPRDKSMHFKLLKMAGFRKIKKHKGKRDFITSIITAKK